MGSTIEELLHAGVLLRFVAIGAYASAFIGYAARLAVKKLKLDMLATLLAGAGVAAHTAYLVTRWVAAGRIEILARERTGDVLTAMDRFWFMIMHPPYTNLFDALNFVAWALMVCYLIVERRWGLRIVGALAVARALVAMGEAALVSDQHIEPLVPALQSYWILIHVAMLFVSYSLFTLGAVMALLYLVKTGTKNATFGAVQAAASALFLALIGGGKLLFSATLQMAPGWTHQTPSKLTPGKMLDVTSAVHYIPAGAEKALKYVTPVSGVGPFLLAAIALFLVSAILYFRAVRSGTDAETVKAPAFTFFALGFGALTVGLALLISRIASGAELQLTLPPGAELARGEHGPFKLSFASNYSLGLIALVWGTSFGYLCTHFLRDRIAAGLPDPRRLEEITYKVIIAGWPLLTIGIVMGGMWANEAWGRFWGWDPKETWALITWVVYAGYLHTRITLGWAGKRPAAIAVFAFAVVVFTFMGVNLGLTGDGLHSYGAG
ncbi:MAG: cytochrome c biogenesis protein CcsA [Deltaproteobacteria bacterium]|nr:cytochrome c biogenesis protein CcsA [Deltaproteobacteria bacterium]